MKITKRQLRRIIKEERRKLIREQYVVEQQISPEAWASKHRGDVDYDEEGQKIIYLSKEDYPREEMVYEYLPREWDFEDTYDESSWVIYTGEYHEEAGVWSDERDYEAGFKS